MGNQAGAYTLATEVTELGVATVRGPDVTEDPKTPDEALSDDDLEAVNGGGDHFATPYGDGGGPRPIK